MFSVYVQSAHYQQQSLYQQYVYIHLDSKLNYGVLSLISDLLTCKSLILAVFIACMWYLIGKQTMQHKLT